MADIQDSVIKHAQADMAASPSMAQPQGIMKAQESPSIWRAVVDYVWDKVKTDVIPTMNAMAKEGAIDLHNAIVPAFPDSLHGVDVPGTPLSPTQYMVNEDFHAYDAEVEAAAQRGHSPLDRGLER